MRISPIRLNYTTTPSKTSPAPNFGACKVEVTKYNPEKIEGIRCANCGKETLTSEKLETIANEMAHAKNAGTLTSIISKYRRYMSKEQLFVNYYFAFKLSPDTSAQKAVSGLADECKDEYSWLINKGVNSLKKLCKNDSMWNKNREVLINTINELEKTGSDDINYPKHKEILQYCQNNIDFKYTNLTIKNLIKSTAYAYQLRTAILNKNICDMNREQMMYEFAKILFQNGLARSVPINGKIDIETDGNKVVVCNDCLNNKKNSMYYPQPASLIRKNLFNYVLDLDEARKKGLVQITPNDTMKVIRFAREFNPELNINSLQFNLLKFLQTHKKLEISSLKDVPCPACGVKMVNSDELKDIENSLALLTKLPSYADKLKNNFRNISPKLHPLAQDYINFVTENPAASDSMVRNYISASTTKVLKNKFDNLCTKIELIISQSNLTQSETVSLINLYDIINDLRDFDSNVHIIKTRQLQEYLVKNPLPEKLRFLKYDLMRLIAKTNIYQNVVFLSQEDSSKIRYWSEGFVKNIFKASSFTTNNIKPNYKDVGDNKTDKIGICKSCNMLKGNLNVEEWYKNIVKHDRNFLIYLNFVQNASDEGRIENYENYSSQIAQKLYELSGESLDLRQAFPLKK